MVITTAKNIKKASGKPPEKLATEGPLSEKDEQGEVIARSQDLAGIALRKWRRLKEKIKDKFKK
ncbi:MAG TPA: hypothetical protein VIM89_04825 [Mucilaginibacter sp.]